jgi:hypothetical protein
MKLSKEIEVKIGADGLIVLREPATKEWNEFTADRYQVGKRNRMKDNSGQAREALFDLLLIKIENIEDDAGAITLETKDRIPARLKGQIIFDVFESGQEVDVKN